MRILVIMSDNRTLDSNITSAKYNSTSVYLNYLYCKKHGYDFHYYRPYLDNPDTISINNCIDPSNKSLRHAAWSKILSSLIAFNTVYDYIVYTDTDCIFRNIDITIEDYISNAGGADIICLNNRPWNEDLPCSGFYMYKPTAAAKRMLIDCYTAQFPNRNLHHDWEQTAFRAVYSNYNYHMIHDDMFIERKGQFLRHIGTHEGHLRNGYFMNLVNARGANYKEVIDTIINHHSTVYCTRDITLNMI